MITPLHVYSGYTHGGGAQTPGALVARAAALGHTHLALSDRNGLYGAPPFYLAAQDAGVTPILGATLQEGAVEVLAWVHQEQGYAHLCQVLTLLHARQAAVADGGGAVPGLVADLAHYAAGLFLATADVATATQLRAAGLGRGHLWLAWDPATQGAVASTALAAAASALDLDLLATAPAAGLGPEDAPVLQVLAAIHARRTVATLAPRPGTARPPWLRPPATLARELAPWPAAVRANATVTAACAAYRWLPRAPVFPACALPAGQAPAARLQELCAAGLRTRYGSQPPAGAATRLARELDVILRMGFVDYFLIVWEIVQYAHDHHSPVAGRGSGASSLVAYLLGITNVCPLAHGLPFERFLHENRPDLPDLDLDFCWYLRDGVIAHVFARWGHDHVAMVSTHPAFQPASAWRETLIAHGYPSDQVPAPPADDTPPSPRLQALAALSQRLVGLPHHLSVHPGGVVITPGPLAACAPLQRATKGCLITQYDKDGVEAVGLVKIDLLGNRTLSTVSATCATLRTQPHPTLAPGALPPADPATWELIRAGDTIGCGQLESPAIRQLLRRFQPRCMDELMMALAIIRPGAANQGMKDALVRRRHGLDPLPPLDPRIHAALLPTWGVLIFEDQVMQVIAGLLEQSLATADGLRRAIQKCHDPQRHDQLAQQFLAGCQAHGVDPAQAQALWPQMAKFNAYSFCKAHAASYANIAYAGAWLKTHHPAAYWCAALTHNHSMYHPRVYLADAQRHGLRLLPPDLNLSAAQPTVEHGALRLGLATVRGLGPAGLTALLDARRHGPFRHLPDLCARTRLGHDELAALIRGGACDAWGTNRPTLLLHLALARAAHPALATTAAPDSLLPDAGSQPPVALPDYPALRKYLDQRRVLGFGFGPHLLALCRPTLAAHTDATKRDLPQRLGQTVRLAGFLEARRTLMTSRGRLASFLTMDEEDGLFEVTFMHDPGRPPPSAFTAYGPYLITGLVESHYGALMIAAHTLTLATVSPLPPGTLPDTPATFPGYFDYAPTAAT